MVRKKNKKNYKPTRSDLRRVLKFIVKSLTKEQRLEIAQQSVKFAKKHYRKVYRSNPDTWKYYTGFEWLSYGIKKALNARLGRTIEDFRSGTLTRHNLYDLALLIGIEDSEIKDINRSVMWQQIVEYVKKNEDSPMNRLLKLWEWLENTKKISEADIKYLKKKAPGYWEDKPFYEGRVCYLDPDWRARHLTNIFEITFIIQEVVDAKLNVKNWTPVVSGMSRLQLRIITQKIMDLEIPNNATKEIMWKMILQKIEQDKMVKIQ